MQQRIVQFQWSRNAEGEETRVQPEWISLGSAVLTQLYFPIISLAISTSGSLQVAKFSEWTDTHIGTHCQLHIGERNVGRTIADSLKNAFSSIPELNCKAGLHKPSLRLEALAELEQIIQI